MVECWIDNHRFHNNSTAIPPSWIAEGNNQWRLLLEEWKTRAFQAEPGNSIYRDRQSVFQPRFINSRPRDNRAKSRGQGDGSRSANNARNGDAVNVGSHGHFVTQKLSAPRYTMAPYWKRDARRLFLDARRAGNNLSAAASINNSYAGTVASLRSAKPRAPGCDSACVTQRATKRH